MGARGPRPKPTNLRVLHGEKQYRINRNEPQPQTSGVPAAPSDMSSDAKKIWRKYAKLLHSKGLFTDWDREQFAIWCESVVVWRKARDMCDMALLINGKKGTIKNPAWQIYRDAAQIVRQYAADFGMNPASRVGLSVDDGRGEDSDLARILS